GTDFVIVAFGNYPESVDLADGVTVFGGFDLGFDARDPVAQRSRLTGSGGPVVLAIGITTPTVFDGFVIDAPVASAAGSASIGMWIEGSPGLIVSNNEVFASFGRDGATGARGAAGAVGADGVNGVMG